MIRIRLSIVKAALAHCAANHQQPFSRRRLMTSTDWIPERKRFAFSNWDC